MVRFRWAGWWLGLMVGAGSPVAAQVLAPAPKVELEDFYPNPLGAATTIPRCAFEVINRLSACESSTLWYKSSRSRCLPRGMGSLSILCA